MFKRKINEADELPKGSLAHAPVLTIRPASVAARAVVLVLHGGRANSYEPVRARHLSPSRMIPFARLLHRWGAPYGLAVWSLRNRVRGWNGEERSPVQDARWALEKIHREHPGLPIYLIGHSMGGSVALAVADDPSVQAVVSLAPWTDPNSDTESVRGRKVLILHGDQDRWTSAPYSQLYAERAAPAARELFYVKLRGAGHFMFSKVPIWHKLSASFILRDFARRFELSLASKITEAADRLYQSPSRLPIER
ncbi:alpha/beta hydrolase [Psychromicrobium lacuslunae]|uniref:alpha/beta hydrolase n=1 Tax=Psychromicrobium lacuslunae TaxID=1618207 RepID=UPI001F1D48C7|nr:alpha/beta fold hydrolase [Psychromicrobium lacuslunae]